MAYRNQKKLSAFALQSFQETAGEFANPLKFLVYPGGETLQVCFGVTATSLSYLMGQLGKARST